MREEVIIDGNTPMQTGNISKACDIELLDKSFIALSVAFTG
jgi:hypothetical protein